MPKNLKVLSLALGVVLLLGVLGAGAAFAQTPTATTATDWQSVFLGKVATILGVDQQRLTDAMKQARGEVENERIDAAVAAGRMSQEYANWLKQRPDDGGHRFGRGDFGFGFGHAKGGRFIGPMKAAPGTAPTPTQ
jgi:hypothetical protein